MSKHISETPATAALKALKVAYTEHVYTYVDRGGTAESAAQLGVDEYCVIKTLVMQDEAAKPVIVLMHGNYSVSTKSLARAIGCKKIEPCTPEVAQRHTGYLVGGTSPFGCKKRLPVYAERSIFELPMLYINGGRRGYLVRLAPSALGMLGALAVDCANAKT
jgi:Cys-tRNA(Pro) deacylase